MEMQIRASLQGHVQLYTKGIGSNNVILIQPCTTAILTCIRCPNGINLAPTCVSHPKTPCKTWLHEHNHKLKKVGKMGLYLRIRWCCMCHVDLFFLITDHRITYSYIFIQAPGNIESSFLCIHYSTNGILEGIHVHSFSVTS